MNYIHYTNILRDLLELKRGARAMLDAAHKIDYFIDNEDIKDSIKTLMEHIKEIILDVDNTYYQIAQITSVNNNSKEEDEE